jgi:hypothetical protein
MKCSDARELALRQRLNDEQVESLRVHARECKRCRAELEGALLALALRGEPLDSPSPSFNDAVMARIEKAPVTGRVSAEDVVTAISFCLGLAGIASVLYLAKEHLLRWWSAGISVELPLEQFREVIVGLARFGQICRAVAPEVYRGIYGHTAANLLTAVIVALALILALFVARRRETGGALQRHD